MKSYEYIANFHGKRSLFLHISIHKNYTTTHEILRPKKKKKKYIYIYTP